MSTNRASAHSCCVITVLFTSLLAAARGIKHQKHLLISYAVPTIHYPVFSIHTSIQLHHTSLALSRDAVALNNTLILCSHFRNVNITVLFISFSMFTKKIPVWDSLFYSEI